MQEVQREFERADVERAVSGYYSALDDREAGEQARWGEFALAQLPREGGSDDGGD